MGGEQRTLSAALTPFFLYVIKRRHMTAIDVRIKNDKTHYKLFKKSLDLYTLSNVSYSIN